jgi:uncharacterized protein (DUF1697 family)
MDKVNYVALLRAINVGGNNVLPMADLARMFSDEGCQNVRTFIQSGNVLFDAPEKVTMLVSKSITTRIAKDFGFKVPVVLRTEAQLRKVISNNPFTKAGKPEENVHVFFLADKPPRERIAALDAQRSPPDEFVVRGQEIYLKFLNGAGKTKLTAAYFDSKLATTGTQRNWRTVTKLLELMRG